MVPPPLPLPASPIPTDRRLDHLDALRGFALFGILLVNMHGFKSSFVSWSATEAYLPGTLNLLTIQLIDVFATGKFVSVFSFLFGLGLAQQWQHWSGTRPSLFRWFILRPMSVLLILGVLHGMVLWCGDILTLYAVMGMTTIFLVRRRIRTLLVLAAAMFLLHSGLWLLGSYLEATDGAMNHNWRETADAWVECYQSDDFWWITGSRIDEWKYALESLFLGLSFHSFVFFLLGMAVGKAGSPQLLERHKGLLRKWLPPALLTGITLSLLGKVQDFGWLRFSEKMWWLRAAQYPGGTTLMALCYITGGALVFRSGRWPYITRSLSAAGRMSLSNYLFQSIAANVIFMGWGLGLYGKTSSFAGLGVSVGVFAVQVVLSQLWLRKFLSGPVEHLSRKLAYPAKKESGA
jgi:uncharacterized protein